MSATAFFTLADPVVPTGTSDPGLNAAARSLEMRKTTGGGPTSALGLSSGTAAYADQMRVTAVDGMIMAPLFVGLNGTGAAATLQVTKSNSTYFIQGGTNPFATRLMLPPLSASVGVASAAAVAGFKARFVLMGALVTGAVSIVPSTYSLAGPSFLGSIVNSASIAPITSGGTNIVLSATAGSITSVTPANAIQTLVKSSIVPTSALVKSIDFVVAAAAAGDWVEVETDGINWYVRGVVASYDAVTFTV